ncbi:hypothetical protein ABZ650_23135 [Streptomyces griseoviridis]|uniref:hypothetical protein n=1 Tax=Streptomyces griseoviridis TaxID=45398 RepID=UPI0033E25C76
MSSIDALLAQSRLLDSPQVPSDVVPYDDLGYAQFIDNEDLLAGCHGTEAADDGAARSLTVLCEAVVAHCTAEQLADFLTDQVPQPRAAWILGCFLQLAGADDGARFWWQYAAGADDAPASYCLYLQHLARGDTHAAALWRAQAGEHAQQDNGTTGPGEHGPAYRLMTADSSLSTVLRVLSHLTRAAPRRQTTTARNVIDFVASAVAIGYDLHPDLEIPLPGQNFDELLGVIVAASSREDWPGAVSTAPSTDLPNRAPAVTPARHVSSEVPSRGPNRLLVEVTDEAGRRPKSVQVLFFKQAVAVCWEAATAARSTDAHGRGVPYILSRFRPLTTRFSSGPSGFGTPAPPGPAAPALRFRGL